MNKNTGAYMGAGMLLGLIFGMLLENIALGLLIGIGLGAAIGVTKIKISNNLEVNAMMAPAYDIYLDNSVIIE